jgi:hypothetical protein
MMGRRQRRSSATGHVSIAESMSDSMRVSDMQVKLNKLVVHCAKQARRIEVLEARHGDVVHFPQLEMALQNAGHDGANLSGILADAKQSYGAEQQLQQQLQQQQLLLQQQQQQLFLQQQQQAEQKQAAAASGAAGELAADPPAADPKAAVAVAAAKEHAHVASLVAVSVPAPAPRTHIESFQDFGAGLRAQFHGLASHAKSGAQARRIAVDEAEQARAAVHEETEQVHGEVVATRAVVDGQGKQVAWLLDQFMDLKAKQHSMSVYLHSTHDEAEHAAQDARKVGEYLAQLEALSEEQEEQGGGAGGSRQQGDGAKPHGLIALLRSLRQRVGAVESKQAEAGIRHSEHARDLEERLQQRMEQVEDCQQHPLTAAPASGGAAAAAPAAAARGSAAAWATRRELEERVSALAQRQAESHAALQAELREVSRAANGSQSAHSGTRRELDMLRENYAQLRRDARGMRDAIDEMRTPLWNELVNLREENKALLAALDRNQAQYRALFSKFQDLGDFVQSSGRAGSAMLGGSPSRAQRGYARGGRSDFPALRS